MNQSQLIDVESGKSVLYFTMNNCSACKKISPTYESCINSFSPFGIKFYKLDVQDNPQMAVKLNVQSFPTFFFINKGNILFKQVGAMEFKLIENCNQLKHIP